MNIEKWLKLILIVVIFAMILFLLSGKGLYDSSKIENRNHTSNQKNDIHIDELHNNESKMDKKTKDKMAMCMSCNSNSNDSNGSNGSNRCKSTGPLLPVMDPRFNMREICKQSVLLEDHLFQKEKRCHDCIIKHFLTIEGLAEEAITLDKEHKYPELNDIPPKVRKIAKKYIDNYKDPKQPAIIAQELREIRKNMMQDCFDAF